MTVQRREFWRWRFGAPPTGLSKDCPKIGPFFVMSNALQTARVGAGGANCPIFLMWLLSLPPMSSRYHGWIRVSKVVDNQRCSTTSGEFFFYLPSKPFELGIWKSFRWISYSGEFLVVYLAGLRFVVSQVSWGTWPPVQPFPHKGHRWMSMKMDVEGELFPWVRFLCFRTCKTRGTPKWKSLLTSGSPTPQRPP